MTNLEKYGWTSVRHEHYIKNKKSDLLPGRVIGVKGFKYHIMTATGELETELSGRLMYASVPQDLPRVGDWVWYMDYGNMGYIVDVFPRQNMLSRKTPGNPAEKQVMAANVDLVLVVQGLDRDFNLKRLDRYRVQIKACGIEPVMVLNKCDLVNNAAALKENVSRFTGCRVYVCSSLTGVGIDELANEVLQPGKTFLLAGSSGAGKSSLLNRLSQTTWQKTGAVSGSNNKGKHTTTTRDLFRLPNGSLVIDTPGMREFGLTDEENNADELFPVIDELAAHCRFPDCGHLHEPGCAVLDALGTGKLDPVLYESYVKLLKEQKRFGIQLRDKKRMEKQFGKLTREAKEHRKKNKF